MFSGGPTPRIATRLPPVCLLGMAWPQCGKTDAPHPAAATASPPVHRACWAEARLTLVGHALLEKLSTAPRKALTAHVLLADPLALDADGWASKPFWPLPVLGVPGWWPSNRDPAFYADSAVFRPPRVRRS